MERLILVKWPSVGWCVGKIVARNLDARVYRRMDGVRSTVNFVVYYDLDQETAKTVLRLDEYGGEEDGSWVLLEKCATSSGGGEAAMSEGGDSGSVAVES